MNTKTPIFHSLTMIEEKIQEKLTVESLASDIHFSKYYYQRMFREVVGDSVMGYVTRRKLTYAARELAETNSTVLEIALKYGYNSHEGFTRSFKTYMGATPAEYRKYHLSIHPGEIKKEKNAMPYSKTTNEIVRELNSLIVEAGETAEYSRKHKGDAPEAEAFYTQFWEFTAVKAEQIAEQLKKTLEHITAISLCPDEISARFLIIKAMEDTAFTASVMAFQTGLTIARAIPEHSHAFHPILEKYDALARHARMKTGKITNFFNELTTLIFQDMKQTALLKFQKSVEAGNAAANQLSFPDLPYAYIEEGIREITERLSATALEDVTVCMLEDSLFRLETIAFAAETEIFRTPSHKPLFNGISSFREQLCETLDFFQNLPADAAEKLSEPGKEPILKRIAEKKYHDLASQESILLFYLKGELQKLGDEHLDIRQKSALETACNKINKAVTLAYHETKTPKAGEVTKLLQEAFDEMTTEAELLGICGNPIRYLANAVIEPAKLLTDNM